MPKMRDEREVAARGLAEILENKAYSNVAMRRILARAEDLNATQRAFVTEIVAGCIRNLHQIDYIIGSFSHVSLAKMKPAIVNILRISVYQMKFMDKVPMFAICDQAVKLAKKMGFAGLSGFVNGVLRNVARNLNSITLPDSFNIMYSCEPWIAAHFTRELGRNAACQLLETVCRPPNVNLCVNTGKISVDELMDVLRDEGVVAVRGSLVENSLIVSKTADIAALPSFRRGLYHVMDEAAMLAVAAVMPAAASRIIDICAAPGGKSFAAAYAAPAARILARDIHDFKVAQLNEGTARLGLNGISAEKWDATVFDERLRDCADLLIADVPCSGLGTLRRRPDIKLFKREESIDELVALQRRILAASWEYVRPGGRLLYSTCTISSRENAENRDWFLANFPFKPVDFSAKLPDFADYTTAADGYVQILPQHYDTDGFFIAIFERV